MLPNKFVILWNNEPVGVDASSGGYPYKTDFPGNVRYWNTQKEAHDYIDVINYNGKYNMKVVEVQFRIV